MLVVSIRVENNEFWSHVEYSGMHEILLFLAVKVSFWVILEEIIKRTLFARRKVVSFKGQIKLESTRLASFRV